MIVINTPIPSSCDRCFCTCTLPYEDICTKYCNLLSKDVTLFTSERREDCPLMDLESIVREVYKHGN